jgi:ribosomal protein S18 acetylase RimI-like enzyme
MRGHKMEYKILEKQDISLMKFFVDDQNTKYNKEFLDAFLKEKNTYGYIVKENNYIVGFAYGYVLVRPDGNKDLYVHSVDILRKYQGRGYGTELMKYIHNHSKNIGCRKMFIVTNKSNLAACKCYEKSGGISDVNGSDDVVYVYK